MIKTPNLRIHRVEEGAEIQTIGIENLFNEIIAENFPNLAWTSKCRRHLESQINMTRKRTSPYHTIVKNVRTAEQRKNIENYKRKMPIYLQTH
jgi:hypothetical protein